jgi:hypothetical protein
MAHFPKGPHRFRIRDQQLYAIVAILLLCCPRSKATTLVVLVSGSTIVFGADSKGIDTWANNIHLVGTSTVEKVLILQDRLMISEMGLARIERPYHGETKIVYDFPSWVRSLHIPNNASVSDVAQLIAEKCWPVFHDEWVRVHPSHPLNLSNDPSLPLVGYYIGGNEFLGPKVYFVGLYPDWKKRS